MLFRSQWTYKTVFNDQYDYYGDKLNFSIRHQISPRPSYETETNLSVYWVDDYNDDRNLNLTAKFMPNYIHKNKSIFPPEKPIQTEHDEIGVNVPFLDNYYGYKDYGNFKVGILPEVHKTTFKNALFDVI